jgi:hypothetical protein
MSLRARLANTLPAGQEDQDDEETIRRALLDPADQAPGF